MAGPCSLRTRAASTTSRIPFGVFAASRVSVPLRIESSVSPRARPFGASAWFFAFVFVSAAAAAPGAATAAAPTAPASLRNVLRPPSDAS